MPQTHFRTCNLCEALCGLEIQTEGKEVLSIKGDKKDPLSRGHICPKAVALKDLHEDPDRLKLPVKKTAEGWKEISWNEAFTEVVDRLKAVQEKYGNDAVGVYQGNPSIHNLGTTLYSPLFIRSLNTKNRFSATSVDQLPHHVASLNMLGNPNLIPIPDIDHTDFWIIMGGNPMVSNGSLMTSPDVGKRIRAIQDRGGKVIVIDPRYTETAAKADQHIFVRPGTDVYLLLGMIREVFENDWVNLNHLLDCIDENEIDQLRQLVHPFSLSKVAQKTRVDEATIKQLTKEYVQSKRAVAYGRLGLSVVEYGGLSQWLVNCLNIITGHFDVPGGAMFPQPAIAVRGNTKGKVRFGRWHSRKRGLPEFGGELPSSTLAEEILEPGDRQIKAMVTSCGNPVLSVPNGNKLDQALDQLDFMVSIDIYINETTRHADIILPPATGLETPHYSLFFHNLAIRNTSKYSPAVFEKQEGAKYDWEIFAELSTRMTTINRPVDMTMIPAPEQILESKLNEGSTGINMKKLQSNPNGIDIGPLQSCIKTLLQTTDEKIKLVPEFYISDFERLSLKIEAKDNGFLLIGRRQLRSNNSWMHNSYRMVKGRERCTLLVHPKDAAELGLSDGSKAEVKSRVGSISIPVEVSDEIMQGTVSIPHGWGHNRKGIRMQVAAAHAGASVNDITDEMMVDQLTGNAAVNGVPVEVIAG